MLSDGRASIAANSLAYSQAESPSLESETYDSPDSKCFPPISVTIAVLRQITRSTPRNCDSYHGARRISNR
jgi:hypothetical protein